MEQENRVPNQDAFNINRKNKRAQINKKKKRIVKIFFGIIILIILSIIALIANDYIILGKNTKTNLVINHNNVTANLKKDVMIEDNVIYLSKQDIANFFDKYVYEETQTNQMITTYDKKIAAIGFDENKIRINGSDKNIDAKAIRKDDTVYLPISEMLDVYNIEMNYIEDTKVITIDSLSREQKKAIISSDVAVKSSTNIISKTVDRVKKGTSVIVISTNNGLSRIRTQNGKVGYIKADKLENEFTVREAMQTEKQIDGKINLTWEYFSEYGRAPDRSGTTIDGLNVVSPAFFYLDDNGRLVENVGQRGTDYINWAHSNGYKVWPMVMNAEAGLQVTSQIMNSYERRQRLIEEIVNVCVKYDLDGINVDFENMKMEDKDLYSRFIIELTPRLKDMGQVVSVDVTAPDGGETWSLCFDRHVIGNVADYIVFMAYDQNGVSSTTPGTTAGYNWVKLSLNKFLQTEEIDADKIILAVPFYARVWTTDANGKVTSNTINMENIDARIPEGTEKKWDDDLKQNYVEYTDGSDKKEIWIEDLDSLRAKISLIRENNLAGVGSWVKDMEPEEVWPMIKEELNK